MEEKNSISENLTLEINRNNIRGWLSLIRDVYPLTDKQKKQLDKFIKTRYKVRRDKLLDEIFKEE